MIAVLVALAFTLLTGAAAVRVIDRNAPTGVAYLYGCGAITLVMTFASWSRTTVTLIAVAAIVTLAFLGLPRAAMRVRLSPLDSVTVVVLALFATLSTITSLWEWDAWAIWALKARVFVEHGSVDWRFLETPTNVFAHPDYPLLVPVNLGLPAVVSGVWNDRWLGLIGVFILAAAVLTVRELTSRTIGRHASALVAFTVAVCGASPYVGTAETPMLALSVAAFACLHAGETRHAAMLFGLAAMAKNEGLALLAAVVLASVVTAIASTFRGSSRAAWADVGKLWPAIALAAPWLMLRALHRLPTDVVAGPATQRALARLGEAPEVLRVLSAATEKPALWIVIGIAAAIAWRGAPLAFGVVALQLAFCVAAYFVTPHDVTWHIVNSWDRVSRQVMTLAAYAAQVALATQFFSLRGTHAEARPEQH